MRYLGVNYFKHLYDTSGADMNSRIVLLRMDKNFLWHHNGPNFYPTYLSKKNMYGPMMFAVLSNHLTKFFGKHKLKWDYAGRIDRKFQTYCDGN